ncbi:MAG TPA: UDP-N-acetylmuramoyl-L-alanyl-D-glutamate--2,6-diaminopimelate ligase [Rectinemataceae bacterium]|nr:UDP-N-acetylmuramoyl-L-alanyl-D-glutamate--2,6-diaminopimelate ligase [Rectinemataceae bacterium]
MLKRLSDILVRAEVLQLRGAADVVVRGLAYDSRAVRPGYLFFALPGLHADGHRFIGAALAAGASAVVHSEELDSYDPRASYARVADPRFAMSPIADDFYGRPSADLAVVGVTGTEGKSTTVYLIYQLLGLVGRRAGFFSTVMSDTGGGERPNPEHQTTPEAPAVHRMLAEMRDAGMAFAVVEASSHGLSPRTNRLGDVAFDVGVMMNVTHEHLEFHGTWERYRSDKANLFRALGRKTSGSRSPFAVANADDPSFDYFLEAAGAVPVRSFSAAGAEAELSASDLVVDAAGESFEILERNSGLRHQARLELPGAFNVGNALAALLAVSGLTGMTVAELVPLLRQLRPVRGRMTTVDRGQNFEVIVDYAHTPSSFQTVFPPLRARVAGKMICVFGSGGERDTEKRPQQGRLAADYFDVVVLADEDPRGEDPTALLEEIAAGCPERRRGLDLFIIPDRPTAIRKAFELAGPGDLVALLGKGHENSIIYADRTVPYDEIAEAEKALGELLARTAD